jgi:hypothetical protein
LPISSKEVVRFNFRKERIRDAFCWVERSSGDRAAFTVLESPAVERNKKRQHQPVPRLPPLFHLIDNGSADDTRGPTDRCTNRRRSTADGSDGRSGSGANSAAAQHSLLSR